MLKLTKKADYGLIALKHLAECRPNSSSAKEIADRYGVPLPLLSKVLQKLARAGYLRSEHGTNGGYRLIRESNRVTALEAIRAIDGPVFLTSCFTERGGCEHSARCTVRDPLKRVHDGILRILEGVTIADLCEESAGEAPEPAACPPPVEVPVLQIS